MMDDTERIRDASDLVSIVAEHIVLRHSGPNRLVGLCLFHEERTPSFNLYIESQRYKCFGCGKSGDVFEFVQEIENLTFPQAKKMLADRAGISLDTGAVRQAKTLWADRQRAEQWAVTARAIAEQELSELGICDPDFAALLHILNTGGDDLIKEFRLWQKSDPDLTQAMIKAGIASQERVERRLALYLMEQANA
jgi:hypothetical protein